MPCLIQISKRTEESVQETLANAVPKIFKALGSFTSDRDVKVHVVTEFPYHFEISVQTDVQLI